MTDLLQRGLSVIVIAGILLALFGAYQFIDGTIKLGSNEAAQIQANGGEIDPQSMSEARGLMTSDLERRDLEMQRYNGMMVGGVGIVIISLGWLINDFVKSRRKKEEMIHTDVANDLA